jgi:hypothetical protein
MWKLCRGEVEDFEGEEKQLIKMMVSPILYLWTGYKHVFLLPCLLAHASFEIISSRLRGVLA